jgi:hypothetical protein
MKSYRFPARTAFHVRTNPVKARGAVTDLAIADQFCIIGIPGCVIRVFRVTLRTPNPYGSPVTHVVGGKAAVDWLGVFVETNKLVLVIIVFIGARMTRLIRVTCR